MAGAGSRRDNRALRNLTLSRQDELLGGDREAGGGLAAGLCRHLLPGLLGFVATLVRPQHLGDAVLQLGEGQAAIFAADHPEPFLDHVPCSPGHWPEPRTFSACVFTSHSLALTLARLG